MLRLPTQTYQRYSVRNLWCSGPLPPVAGAQLTGEARSIECLATWSAPPSSCPIAQNHQRAWARGNWPPSAPKAPTLGCSLRGCWCAAQGAPHWWKSGVFLLFLGTMSQHICVVSPANSRLPKSSNQIRSLLSLPPKKFALPNGQVSRVLLATLYKGSMPQAAGKRGLISLM